QRYHLQKRDRSRATHQRAVDVEIETMMRRYRMFVAALFIAVSAMAQRGAETNVHVVELPVSVVDASGNPVRALTAANFTLYDENKKQPITSFDAIDFASGEAS